jgi:hypothetical protein
MRPVRSGGARRSVPSAGDFVLGPRPRGRETETEPNENYARSQAELADMPSMPGGRTECPETSFIMRLS